MSSLMVALKAPFTGEPSDPAMTAIVWAVIGAIVAKKLGEQA